ncbi:MULTISPECIES: LacI family DNA-binding transcriptional regulator [unclassified Sphingobium]|uniref:LacI family DNA-binding transcriptional regulator n=1 Tax=unclassified Sphingobium TaxID=2611147 RepID=UPI000A71DF88|nr:MULTISPECIES: LacI family DNA-binding transcriptional regulator [unclassified Sphingobium]
MPATIQPSRIVTLKRVAQEADVHPSTASRALNPETRHLVAEDVAERVTSVARTLGYRRNLLAAGLRTGRSHLVGMLVPDIANTVFSPILSGAAERLAAEGFSTVVADVGRQPARELEVARELATRQVEGLILATAQRDDPVVDFCLAQGIPTVLVNRAEEKRRLSAVVSDDALGMQLAVDHVFELGHRAIAHLAGPEAISTGHLRRRAFYGAMDHHGLRSGDDLHESTQGYSREEGAAATRRLLERRPDVTAIVAANDLLALGAYDALRECGLRCPQDVSVVGHNDMPMVDLVSPPLTTVRISQEALGREAADLLLHRIRGEDSGRRNIVLAPSLIVRESAAAPRKAGLPGGGAAKQLVGS